VGLAILLVVVVVAAGFKLRDMYRDLLSDTPASLPVMTLSEDEKAAIRDKFASVPVTVLSGEPGSFAFTEEDLNELVASVDEFDELRGKVYFRVLEDTLAIDVALGLDFIDVELLAGKYLNGRLALNLDVRGGRAHCHVADMRLNDKPVPKWITRMAGKSNLLAEAYADEEARLMLDAVADISVSDNALHLETKAGPKYLADAPLRVRMYRPTAAEKERTRAKIARLQEAARNGEVATVKFSEKELNTILVSDSALEDNPGRYRGELYRDVMRVKGTTPLAEFLKAEAAAGKHVNAEFSLEAVEEEGRAALLVRGLKVNGNELPPVLAEELVGEDLLQKALEDPAGDRSELLTRIRSMTIRDGNLAVTTKGR